MHAVAASFYFSSFVSIAVAHGTGYGVRMSRSEVNIRLGASYHPQELEPKDLEKRSMCGDGYGPCPDGLCCSGAGYCGSTEAYCKGPDCQLEYSGLACDASNPPPGESTLGVDRTHIGDVAYGTIITNCTTPSTLALSFDDGPYNFTSHILDVLESYNVTATFFICANNLGKGRIDDPANPWADILQRMHSAGHQLASHSYSHQDLTLVNSTIRQQQVIYNEMAFRNLFGFFPAYLRPPYDECSSASGCLDDLTDLGYHLVNYNIDTKDYLNDSPLLIQNSKDTFSAAVSNDSASNAYIELTHDTHEQTAYNLTAFMIETLLARGYNPVPIGTCLGDPVENWYRDASATISNDTSSSTGSTSSGIPTVTTSVACSCATVTVALPPTSTRTSTTTSSSTSTSPTATVVSTDGTCGGVEGFTCQGSTFGDCCSAYGHCGSASAYCSGGCQSAFGTCSTVSATLTVSDNGLCGAASNQTCTGSTYGNCCSKYGYCGSTADYCGTSCQSGYGTCT
ncbi:hypothetical protein BX600DRAFT_473154 [Xylariales sp. PMI_506]|nr:hypothetical protein BX600DRAFT_473154 [Xylariales sp. PMI_506]